MAELKYSPNANLFGLCISDREKVFEKSSCCYRSCLFHDHTDNNSNTQRLADLFNYKFDNTGYESKLVKKDVNPWIMRINFKLVVYFGEDKPVIKSKTIKSCTPSYKKWTGHNWKDPKEPETYYYVEVKENDKLFIFGNTYHFDSHPSECEILEGQYLTKFDISNKSYNEKIAEKIKADKAEKERQEQYYRECEERKSTPGYCCRCGAEHAMLIADPFNSEMNGDYTPIWLCPMCYENSLGDI